MLETLTTLTVLSVIALLIFRSRMKARAAELRHTPAEIERLQHHAAWLEQRLEVAQREKWGDDMVAGISAELKAALSELGQSVGEKARG